MVLTNQAAFWRREIHNAIGYLDEGYDCSFDYDWFLRVLQGGRNAAHVNSTLGALRLHEDTKTSNRQPIFDAEYEKIRNGRQASVLNKKYYQMRRMALMLKQGDFSYIARGIVRRLKQN
jgi:hypothetical protein